MSRLPFPDYLRHLRSESARFREVLSGCAPSARVPGCPAWSAADLLWHLTEVQHFWGYIVGSRPDAPDAYHEPPRPATYDDLLAAFDQASSTLLTQLGDADPAEKAWTWSEEQSIGFIYRRQAHEALIHRLDAEQAADAVTPLNPVLATDGVDEVLDVMYGGSPPWGSFAPLQHFVRIDLTDTHESVWVQIGHFSGTDPADDVHYEMDALAVVPDPGLEADTVVRGPAGAVDTWLWRRGDDSEVRVTGHRGVYDHFRAAVHDPIT